MLGGKKTRSIDLTGSTNIQATFNNQISIKEYIVKIQK